MPLAVGLFCRFARGMKDEAFRTRQSSWPSDEHEIVRRMLFGDQHHQRQFSGPIHANADSIHLLVATRESQRFDALEHCGRAAKLRSQAKTARWPQIRRRAREARSESILSRRRGRFRRIDGVLGRKLRTAETLVLTDSSIDSPRDRLKEAFESVETGGRSKIGLDPKS
jgi:hypothetical protein